DYVENRHGDSGRIAQMGEPLTALNFRGEPVEDQARFLNLGVFMEWEQTLARGRWLSAGVRGDYHELRVQSDDFSNVSAGATDHSAQWSGFARYEQALMSLPMTLYTGFGRSERAPDFWERGREFFLSNEVLNQADLGITLSTERVNGTLSLFYGIYDDFILVTDNGDSAENINAELLGGEADITIALNAAWQAQASIAYTRARNKTDSVALAQTPPLEATLGVEFSQHGWLAGALWRGVARQHRTDEGRGTIYSLDTSETPGFATASLYGGYQFTPMTRVTVGADNLFDRRYVEHIQRGSADFGVSDKRIPEPGRYLWANVSLEF
ncbi:MAG: TonB-dependent receptor, partial [Halomonadaceae bacterium]